MQKIIINPSPSKGLFFLLLVLHLAAGVSVFLAAIPLAVQMACAAVLMASLFFSIKKVVYFKGRNNIKSCEYKDQVWRLRLNNKETVEAALLPSSFVSHALIVLNFKADAYGRKNLLLTRGSFTKEDFRQLRLALVMH